MNLGDWLAKARMQRQVREGEVTEFACLSQATRAKRLTDSFFGVVGTMDVEMNPPRTVVVVQVMIPIPRIGAESKRAG